MDKELEQLVRRRAAHHCEYCQMPQSASQLKFPIDHIIARQHGGTASQDNLALCCGRCNQRKGPNIAGMDPQTGRMMRLFNPRRDAWKEHFRYEGAVLIGLTDVGRTTVDVLGINHPSRITVRQCLIEHDFF